MTAPAGRCYCQGKDCAASNLLANAYCYKCGQQMRKTPVLTKPPSAQPTGKGGGKGKNGTWQWQPEDDEGDWTPAGRKKKVTFADDQGKGKGKKGKSGGGGKGGGMKCLCCGGANHTKAECRQAEKECNICGKIGHLAAVCRAVPPSAPPSEQGKTDEDFKARAIREGWIPPAVVEQPQAAPPEPTVASISDKGKAKDAAQKAFELAGKRKIAAKQALTKAEEHLEKMAAEVTKALAEFKLELSLASKAMTPAAPKAAIDLDQILAAVEDPTMVSKLFVSMGEDWGLEDADPSDYQKLSEIVGGLKQALVLHCATFIPTLKQQFLEAQLALADSRWKHKNAGASSDSAEAPAADALRITYLSAATAADRSAQLELAKVKAEAEARAAELVREQEAAKQEQARAREAKAAEAKKAAEEAELKKLAEEKELQDTLDAALTKAAKDAKKLNEAVACSIGLQDGPEMEEKDAGKAHAANVQVEAPTQTFLQWQQQKQQTQKQQVILDIQSKEAADLTASQKSKQDALMEDQVKRKLIHDEAMAEQKAMSDNQQLEREGMQHRHSGEQRMLYMESAKASQDMGPTAAYGKDAKRPEPISTPYGSN